MADFSLSSCPLAWPRSTRELALWQIDGRNVLEYLALVIRLSFSRADWEEWTSFFGTVVRRGMIVYRPTVKVQYWAA